MREIRSLTGIRGLAAVYVMFYHFADRRVAQGTGPIKVLIDHGYISVDLFFALSGFVMALTYRGLFAERRLWSAHRTFLARRVARVYPLYLVMTLAMAALIATDLSDMIPRHALPMFLGANLLMVQSWVGIISLDFPAWSISTEWGAYMVFPPLLLLTLRTRPPVACVVALVAFAAVALVALLPGWTFDHPGREGTLNVFLGVVPPMTRCIAEFTFGLLSFRLAGTALGKRMAADGTASALLAVLVVAALCIPDDDLLLAAAFPLLVVSVSADKGAVARFLGWRPIHLLGVWSYAIYLIHPHVARAVGPVRLFLERRDVPAREVMVIGLGSLIAIGLASLAYEWIEKPGRRLLQHALTRGRAAGGDGSRPAARQAG